MHVEEAVAFGVYMPSSLFEFKMNTRQALNLAVSSSLWFMAAKFRRSGECLSFRMFNALFDFRIVTIYYSGLFLRPNPHLTLDMPRTRLKVALFDYSDKRQVSAKWTFRLLRPILTII